MLKTNFYVLFLLLLSLTMFSGCATTDKSISLLYEPTGTARGGFGEIVIDAPSGSKRSEKMRGQQWELGKISDKDGNIIAKVKSIRSPEALVIDAFTQELKSSGYNPITLGDSMSPAAEKGLRIIDVSIQLDDVKKFLSDEATCVAMLTVQPLKHGKETKKLYYESRITSSRISDRDQIAADVLHKTLQNLMKKAMPDIVKLIE